MPGVLLDTHALYWLVSGEEPLIEDALVAIGEGQESGALFVSPIRAWELSVASKKTRIAGRPHLGDDPLDQWFKDAISVTEAKIIPIHQRISLEAAKVVTQTGHNDPGRLLLDCDREDQEGADRHPRRDNSSYRRGSSRLSGSHRLLACAKRNMRSPVFQCFLEEDGGLGSGYAPVARCAVLSSL